MTYSSFWTVVFGIGIGTYIIRLSMLLLSSKVKITDRMKEILTFVPCAIFPALFMPMAFFHQGESELLMQKERLVTMLIAIVIAYRSKNILLTIVAGLSLLFVFTLT